MPSLIFIKGFKNSSGCFSLTSSLCLCLLLVAIICLGLGLLCVYLWLLFRVAGGVAKALCDEGNFLNT